MPPCNPGPMLARREGRHSLYLGNSSMCSRGPLLPVKLQLMPNCARGAHVAVHLDCQRGCTVPRPRGRQAKPQKQKHRGRGEH